MSTYFNSNDLISLSEVSDMLMMNSIPAVKKWIRNKNICMEKISKSYYVYGVQVKSELEKPLALNLKINYPDQWKGMYKDVASSDSVYNLVVRQIGEEVVHKPIYKVKTKGVRDEKLLKQLLSI